MNVDSFKPTAVVIQSASTAADDLFCRLQSKTKALNSGLSLSVQVSLSNEDCFCMKSKSGLATSGDNTYLRMDADAVDDTNNLDVIAVTDGKAKKVTTFISDCTAPVLRAFEMNLDKRWVNLTFSETMNSSTLSLKDVIIQNGPNKTSRTSLFVLTEGEVVSSVDGITLRIILTETNLNKIKADSNLATKIEDTYLALGSGAASDLSGNQFGGIAENAAVSADDFVKDSSPPSLDSFTLDMNNGKMVLTFSETIQVSTFNVSSITIQGTRSEALASNSVRLTSGNVNGTSETVDQQALQKLLSVAVSLGSTYLSHFSTLVKDMADQRRRPYFDKFCSAGKE